MPIKPDAVFTDLFLSNFFDRDIAKKLDEALEVSFIVFSSLSGSSTFDLEVFDVIKYHVGQIIHTSSVLHIQQGLIQ